MFGGTGCACDGPSPESSSTPMDAAAHGRPRRARIAVPRASRTAAPPSTMSSVSNAGMSQKLVTKKNGKLRRLKELYPEINCKLFYQRDYLNLVVKYGLEGPENMDESPAPTRMPGRPAVVRLEERGERLTG